MELALFDGHCDTIHRCWETGEGLDENTGAVDLKRGRAFGRYCQFFALWAEERRGDGPGSTAICEAQYQLFRREMVRCRDRVLHCCTAEEAEQAHRAGKAAAFLSVEGGHLLGCDIEGLRRAHRWGVRSVNLTWNHANVLSGSCVEEPERGLSRMGKAFVDEMQRLGMLVDLSHLSDPGFWDVMERAERPVWASHSNARAICPNRRNLTDAQITAIIKNRGVIGLNFHRPFLGEGSGRDGLRRHLDHILDLGGADCVGLGGDLDGCTPASGLEELGAVERLWEYLLRKNYPQSLLCNLFYNNLMRVVIV